MYEWMVSVGGVETVVEEGECDMTGSRLRLCLRMRWWWELMLTPTSSSI